MLGIFILIGLGMAASFISFDGGTDDVELAETLPEQDGGGAFLNVAPELPDLLSDLPEAVFAEEYRDETQARIDTLIAEGEITEAEGDLFIELIDFRSGTIRVDTAGGDDAVLGGAGDDLILTGDGEDEVNGGPGDDRVELGRNSDIYGFDSRSAVREDDIEPFPSGDAGNIVEADLEGGDDTVFGGSGVDYIADGFGMNRILGQQGNDFIISVDQDDLSPDRVDGGAGDDVLIVDQGDQVTGGNGADRITVDVFEGVADGYQVVEITDFVQGEDILELEGNQAELRTPEPDGPDDVVENPIAVRDLPNGLDAIVTVGGIDVVLVRGGHGMTVADVLIST